MVLFEVGSSLNWLDPGLSELKFRVLRAIPSLFRMPAKARESS